MYYNIVYIYQENLYPVIFSLSELVCTNSKPGVAMPVLEDALDNVEDVDSQQSGISQSEEVRKLDFDQQEIPKRPKGSKWVQTQLEKSKITVEEESYEDVSFNRFHQKLA